MLPAIDSVDVNKFKGIVLDNKDICTLELTVTTGLEEVAAQEFQEKLSVDTVICRGRVLFDINISQVPKVLEMRSVDHVNVILKMDTGLQLTDEREECFKKIYKFSGAPDWFKGIEVWQSVFGISLDNPFQWKQTLQDGYCNPKPEVDLQMIKKDSIISGNLPENFLNSILKNECDASKNKEKESDEKDIITPRTQRVTSGGPKFRVSCHRVGSNHKFGSPEAARQFGGGLNELFGWPVDLNNFDLEVQLSIIQDLVYVGISLTKESLFRRNLTQFGPTNLRSTISYSMLRLAKPEPGDLIIDPMCGGSSIPIEGSLSFKDCIFMGGDNFPLAINRSRQNIDYLVTQKNSMCIDVAQWDVTNLPLRSQLADIIVCDLPFGKRCGSKVDNRVLYFKALVELARVTKIQTGRGVFLTHDRNSMIKNLQRVSSLWRSFSTRTINIGGLFAGIFILHRTKLHTDESLLPEFASNLERHRKKRKRPMDKLEDNDN